METLARTRTWRWLAALALFALPGCARRAPSALTVRWVVGAAEPRFDPDGPPNAVRWALERWLSTGLVDQDSAGHVVPAAAESWEASADGRTWTFHLRGGLRFADGGACGSEAFARALSAGWTRSDHATKRWLLDALRGAERVRAGRPLPPLGIETPDPRTLVLRLARPETGLLQRLALPGVSTPWRDRAPPAGWSAAVGIGPYRVLAADPGRGLSLVPIGPHAGGPDTLMVRFVVGAPRVRSLLRQGRADLAWPLPPALLDESLPPGCVAHSAPARPARTLLLVQRADTPPVHRLPARAALAHSLNRELAVAALGPTGAVAEGWPMGAGRFEFPAFDPGAVHDWMDRGKLGRSFHVTLGYDADGVGAAMARSLQGEWARLGIYVGLEPERDGDAERQALVDGPQLVLTESQPLLARPEAELAALVMPLRGPAVGAARTGWRTREFDRWLWPGTRPPAERFDPEAARLRLEEECIALPLARLPWVWVTRSGAAALALHPRFGPACIPHDPPPPSQLAR